VRRAHPLLRERATFLRLCTWLRRDGVILIIDGKPGRKYRQSIFDLRQMTRRTTGA
jgi:hypothetical protein